MADDISIKIFVSVLIQVTEQTTDADQAVISRNSAETDIYIRCVPPTDLP